MQSNTSYWNSVGYWKGMMFQSLTRSKGFNYLELGIGAGNTWKYIDDELKTGVDISIKGQNIHTCSTDDFFANNKNRFDIIFVDAFHEKNQVIRDYINAYNCLTDNGMMFFHDICPYFPEQTVQTACGDAYKFWIRLCEKNSENESLFTMTEKNMQGESDTLGIIIKSTHQPLTVEDFVDTDYSWEYYKTVQKRIIFDKHIDYLQLLDKISKRN